MMRTLSRRLFTLLTVLVLLSVSSCSSGSSSLTAPSDSDRPLILVMYGDSLLTFPQNGGAIVVYIEMLEEDLGVHVNLQLPSMGPCCIPPRIVHHLTSDQAKSQLEGADVVIIESPVSRLGGSAMTVAGFEGVDPADCGGDDNQQCLRDSLAEYKDAVEEIFSLLTEAVDPSETLIRAVDGYAPFVQDQLAADTLQITNPYWQEAQEFFAETAATYGIPTAQVFAEFNGPDGTDDPQDRGLIGSDRLHPSGAGVLLIADLIYDLGYDFAD